MNLISILLLILIAAALILAIIKLQRNKRQGKHCCGSCTFCDANCASRKEPKPDSDSKNS